MQIMTIEKDKIEISSREIAELTSKDHKHVKRDIEVALKEDAPKFGLIYLDSMNRTQTEYVLPKNIALGIVSGYSFDLRMKIINRLEQLEGEKNKPMTIEQLLEHNVKVIGQLQNKVVLLEDKIEYDKPKVSFATTVESSINSVLIRDWAKSIGLREKDVRNWLQEKKLIYRDAKGMWRHYATDRAKKYLEEIPTTNATTKGTFLNYTVKIRGDGQVALTDIILAELSKNKDDAQNGRA